MGGHKASSVPAFVCLVPLVLSERDALRVIRVKGAPGRGAGWGAGDACTLVPIAVYCIAVYKRYLVAEPKRRKGQKPC